MSENIRKRLLGSSTDDPGCEACFEVLDQYAEVLLQGGDAAKQFPELIAHIESCPACREDTEGFIAFLRSQPPNEPK